MGAAQARAQVVPFGFPGAGVVVAVPPPVGVLRSPGGPGPAASSQPPPARVEALDDAFEVVPLKYADVSEIVGLLTSDQSIKPNDTFSPQEPAFGSAGIQGYAGGGYGGGGTLGAPLIGGGAVGPAGSTESLGQTVDEAVGVDRRLNAIVLRGPPARVERLRALIRKLDVPVSSVVLETVFVELTETGARNIGLNLSNANNQIGVVSYALTAGGSTASGTDSGVAAGLSLGLQAAIYAQVAKGQGRIVSKPRIAAQNGATAKIITGDALPILTAIALSGVNAVQQQVQYVNVGVTLQIAPRVSDDGFVTSHIFAEVSSVTGYAQGFPTISQREASTSATVKDGESFVIGGLTQESRLVQHAKVPGLGSLPVVGLLFGAENSSTAKTDLYIVVTPRVVRSGS